MRTLYVSLCDFRSLCTIYVHIIAHTHFICANVVDERAVIEYFSVVRVYRVYLVGI